MSMVMPRVVGLSAFASRAGSLMICERNVGWAPVRFGRISCATIRSGDAPSTRADATNSRSRSASTWLRSSRAVYGKPKKPITEIRIAIRSPLPCTGPTAPTLPSTASNATEKSSTGKAISTSRAREITASTQPPT